MVCRTLRPVNNPENAFHHRVSQSLTEKDQENDKVCGSDKFALCIELQIGENDATACFPPWAPLCVLRG
jgi:hypothetical protein